MPDRAAIIAEPFPPTELTGPAIPGTLPGAAGGLIADLVGQTPVVPPPPPVAEPPAAPIRVSSAVQAARIIHRVMPVYPPLARRVSISGTVRLQAIIAVDGSIAELSVVSGHPMLIAAALDAVKQWVYRPTVLNGEPVPVDTQINVNFTLGR
jgi:protein TonB